MTARFTSGRACILGAALALLGGATVLAAENGSKNVQGAVELSTGDKVPQNPSLAKLNLTSEQREQIRKGVLGQNTEVEFKLKTTKSAKGFNPQVGAKLPKGVTGHSLPPSVLAQLPQLRDYKYVTLKDKVL